MAGMYCQGESSNSGGYIGFHDHNTSNGRQFYHGESSNSGGQVSSHSTENYGFVGQYNISNPRGHSSESFSQAHIPQQYKSHRPNSNNGGSNGSRYNSRSRSNGGFNTRHNGNNGFSGSSGSNSKGGSSWNNWNGNTGQKSHVIPECQICSKRGHTAPNCYYRNEQQPMVNHGIPECQICGKRGHVALNCFHRSNYAYQGANPPATLIVMTAQSSSDFNANQAWIMDTGATHHMTGDLHDLNVVTPFEGDQEITVGSGECLPVKHTGSNSLHTPSKTLNLLTVLHVPNLAASLLSIYTLCKDNKCYVIMDKFGFLGAGQDNKGNSNERKE